MLTLDDLKAELRDLGIAVYDAQYGCTMTSPFIEMVVKISVYRFRETQDQGVVDMC